MAYDIFISYAHVDNKPLPGVEHGWVTNFVEALKITLAKEMGRNDKFSLWMDYEKLRGNHALTPRDPWCCGRGPSASVVSFQALSRVYVVLRGA